MKKRFCHECGTPAALDSIFCEECGATLRPFFRDLASGEPLRSSPKAVLAGFAPSTASRQRQALLVAGGLVVALALAGGGVWFALTPQSATEQGVPAQSSAEKNESQNVAQSVQPSNSEIVIGKTLSPNDMRRFDKTFSYFESSVLNEGNVHYFIMAGSTKKSDKVTVYVAKMITDEQWAPITETITDLSGADILKYRKKTVVIDEDGTLGYNKLLTASDKIGFPEESEFGVLPTVCTSDNKRMPIVGFMTYDDAKEQSLPIPGKSTWSVDNQGNLTPIDRMKVVCPQQEWGK